jgi:hypothetical protein
VIVTVPVLLLLVLLGVPLRIHTGIGTVVLDCVLLLPPTGSATGWYNQGALLLASTG